MAAAKPKKRKFMYPGMLMEETDSSSNSSITHSNENQPQQKEKSVHPQIISSPIAGPSNAHRRKFKYPGMLMEESDDSLADQETQIDGEQGEESSERPLSPIAGPSNPHREPTAGPSTIQETQPEPLTSTDSSWFEEETKVFENEDFALYIQKQDHQRQKVFRLEDHLFVMRIKLKNHKKPPLLGSIRDIIEQTMTVMVNDLKNHYNPEEQNLIYVTIKQPGNSCKHDCEIIKLI